MKRFEIRGGRGVTSGHRGLGRREATNAMTDRRTRKRIRLVVLLAAFVLAGGASAYFTTVGTGSGTAAVATSSDVTIAPSTAVAGLYPGGSGELALAISNPNAFPVHVSSLALDTSLGSGGFAADSGHAGCTHPSLSLATQNNGGSGWLVPAKVGTTNGTLSLQLASAVAMGADADAACQGAAFTVYVRTGS